MAHKKAGGNDKNLRDSAGKRLGIKMFGGEKVTAGNIICRQRGTKWHAGEGVGVGKDYTIFAVRDGHVKYTQKKLKKYDGNVVKNTIINVVD